MRRALLVVGGSVLLAACGTTVPVTSQGSAGSGDGLGVTGPVASASAAPLGVDPGVTAPSGGTTGGGSAPAPRSSATAPTAVGSGPAVVTGGGRETGPLSIGIVLTGTSNADDLGVSLGNTVDERDVDEALVAAINERGGLAGRKLVPVYASTDTGSNNWESDFAAACATLTQDHKVAAVLGYVFNYSRSFEQCLSSRGVPHLNTGFNIPGNQELRKWPLHVALQVPTIDRRGLVKLVGAHSDGLLTPKNRIGVLTENCPGTQESLQQTFLPQVKSYGLTVAQTVTLNCPGGAADASGAVAALQNAVLKFASSRVDRVIIHASSEGPALLLFAISAESQGYRPTYLVSSLANLEALRTQVPAAQVRNVHGYGWIPNQDIPPARYPAKNALQTRCLDLLRSKGIRLVSGPDYAYAYNICEGVFLYEKALLATSGRTQGSGIVTTVKGFGTSFASVTNLGGSSFDPSLADAPRSARHLVYTDACSCFAYTGATRPIPSSVQR